MPSCSPGGGRREECFFMEPESHTVAPGKQTDMRSIAKSVFSSILRACSGLSVVYDTYQKAASFLLSLVKYSGNTFGCARGSSSSSREVAGSQSLRPSQDRPDPATSLLFLQETAIREWMQLSAELLGLPLLQLRNGVTLLGQIGKDEDLLHVGR